MIRRLSLITLLTVSACASSPPTLPATREPAVQGWQGGVGDGKWVSEPRKGFRQYVELKGGNFDLQTSMWPYWSWSSRAKGTFTLDKTESKLKFEVREAAQGSQGGFNPVDPLYMWDLGNGQRIMPTTGMPVVMEITADYGSSFKSRDVLWWKE